MKYFIFIICLLFSFSCVSQKKDVITKSTIKFEGKNTNITDLVCIKGLFHSSNYQSNENVIFFEDGTVIKFLSKEQIEKNQNIVNLSDPVYHSESKGRIRFLGQRGVYTVKNDTIITHMYGAPALLVGWLLDEERYKILDRKTIKKIYVKGLLKAHEKYYKESGQSPWIDETIMHFYPADTLPSSDNWLKENKWIWRNESDWKNYMQHVEQIKKQYKKK